MEDGNDLERLIKLLKKTQGSNDHESLMAIRMTNAFLEKKSWDWESLLRGKIKVIADPFSMVAPPPKPKAPPAPMPTATTTRTRAQQDATLRESIRAKQATLRDSIRAKQATDAAQRQRAQADAWDHFDKTHLDKKWPSSSNANRPNPFANSAQQAQSAPIPRVSPLRANKYPGNCWQCGYFVDRNGGYIFQCPNTSSANWEILCPPCEAATKGGTDQLSQFRAVRKNSPHPAAVPSPNDL